MPKVVIADSEVDVDALVETVQSERASYRQNGGVAVAFS